MLVYPLWLLNKVLILELYMEITPVMIGKSRNVTEAVTGDFLKYRIEQNIVEHATTLNHKLIWLTGQVIKAWDIGVATMKIGEICQLICKPEYAYGAAGSPPKIPPNATLVFQVRSRRIWRDYSK